MSPFNSPHVQDLILDNGWEAIPSSFITREGRNALMDERERRLYLPIESARGVINLTQILCPILSWVVVKFVVYQARCVSSIAGLNAWKDIVRILKFREFLSKSSKCEYPEILEQALISQVEWVIGYYAQAGSLWNIYRFVQFYIWAAENYPELGFSVAYADELQEMTIPGNPKGEAVREEFSQGGALHPDLETPLILRALENDSGNEYAHYQQRAAVALSLSYGRNSANYTALNEEDLYDALDMPDNPLWTLNIPRIKKRYISHRSDFVSESVESNTLRHIQALIEQNQALSDQVEVNGELISTDRPLFRRARANSVFLRVGMYAPVYRMYSCHFARLLSDFAERVELVSPLTGEIMHLTPRRFRYTVGCVYAAMGVSRKELAVRLDHSDVQNVEVYFTLLTNMRTSLDKAAAIHFASKVNAFLGANPVDENLIGSDRRVLASFEDSGEVEAMGGCGREAECGRFPPWSCYLCPKFQPFRSSVHERVLEQLLRLQKAIRSPNGLGVGLADVIMAVAQVVSMCNEGAADGPQVSS
ncbi:site-specific integrase [Aquipseudomonas campi]|uniref:Site-specific integrase n=1 Tax=Aquipseudomonas campi TaxID=2731681 RepID=A0A6M8FCN9_9GAMM|nr:site-specific integrase [Pseudomonas campi]QKE61870.1 site-specific integrase [Pseudomonas campi]